MGLVHWLSENWKSLAELLGVILFSLIVGVQGFLRFKKTNSPDGVLERIGAALIRVGSFYSSVLDRLKIPNRLKEVDEEKQLSLELDKAQEKGKPLGSDSN